VSRQSVISPHFGKPVLSAVLLHSLSIGAIFSVVFNAKNPIIPAANEESKITNFALFIIVSLSNASNVMKIDIVKPIPAKNPTPKIDFQFKSLGSLQSPKVTANNVKMKIPKGFPTISPSAIPTL